MIFLDCGDCSTNVPDIPMAEKQVARIVSIPSHENITLDEAEYVASRIREFYGE